MPVRHIPGRRSGGVFADTAELDAWLLQAPPNAHSASADSPNLSNGANHRTAVASESPSSVDGSNPGPSTRWRLLPWFIGVTVVVTAVATFGVGMGRSGPARSTVPSRLDLNGTAIVAKAPDESVLWTYQLQDSSGRPMMGPVSLNGVASVTRAGRGDLDIVAVVSANELSTSRVEVHCFTPDGRLRWRYTPDFNLAFGTSSFAGPWRLSNWTQSELHGDLWISVADPNWWPSLVVSVSADGEATLRFVNAGHIETVASMHSGRTAVMLAGGVNNEFRSAALAVLDTSRSAASPQTEGSDFFCSECPNGQPLKYFLFPRTEVSVALGEPLNFAYAITPLNGSGAAAEVSVKESQAAGLRSIYRLGPDLVPISVAMSDRYWEVHRDLSRQGKLGHAPEDCPERDRGMMARMWTQESGWQDILVPPMLASDARPSRSTRTGQ